GHGRGAALVSAVLEPIQRTGAQLHQAGRELWLLRHRADLGYDPAGLAATGSGPGASAFSTGAGDCPVHQRSGVSQRAQRTPGTTSGLGAAEPVRLEGGGGNGLSL